MNVALYSVGGIVVGAVLQYVVTRILEDRRHLRELRTRAYTDYLQSVSEIKHRFVQPQAQRERELLARLTDAKVRIALYGTTAVVRELAEFEGCGGFIQGEAAERAFVGVVRAMRGGDAASEADISRIVLGARGDDA